LREDDGLYGATGGPFGAPWQLLVAAGVMTAYWAEAEGNPLTKGVIRRASNYADRRPNEGKKVRLGIANSALFATITTTQLRAVNAMHDSHAVGGMVPHG